MTRSEWVQDQNVALLTDLYQLTMLQAYVNERMEDEAVFDLFIRRLGKRNYLIACGLDTVLHYLENLRFSEESLAYLATLPGFSASFIHWLADFRFTGDVYALREGTPFFACEPVLHVVAPIGQAQLVESFLLNQITFQTGIASKAARVVHVAGDCQVVDFGLRRMHGADATMRAARACYIAGYTGTSNVLAGQVYGIPVRGTMAHSYIQAHETEDKALAEFIRLYPGTTLLVDTYDTLAGIEKVVLLASGQSDVKKVGAVRLDSGDLAALATESRARLDAHGLQGVKIFVSGSLDEYSILELMSRGAPIDGLGVGTRVGSLADQPYLDSVYKLAEYAGKGRMKLSSAKSNTPGRKQLFRYFKDGKSERDVIAEWGEPLDGEPLLECVMKEGRRTAAGQDSLETIRDRVSKSMAYLPDTLFSLHTATPSYDVKVSGRLREKTDSLRRELSGDA